MAYEKYIFLISLSVAMMSAIDIDVDQIKSQLPSEFANANFSTEDAKKLFMEKCKKVSGDDEAYLEIEKSTTTLMECVTGIVNVTAIQSEIDEARPIGELDTVFNKYCKKRPEALQCVKDFNKKLEACLDKEERENHDVFMRIITSLLNFVCHKGGDQIALFIAEKGPECLEDNKEPITNCLNKTFSEYIPKEGLSDVSNLPQFILGPKQCGDMQDLETCIVTALEKCEEITPANIVESMFRFIKNETQCRTEVATAHKSYSSSASGFAFSVFGMIFSILIAKILSF